MQEIVSEYKKSRLLAAMTVVTGLLGLFLLITFFQAIADRQRVKVLSTEKEQLSSEQQKLSVGLDTLQKSYDRLKSEDQFKVNQQLKTDISQTHEDYKSSIDLFEQIQDLKARKQDTAKFEQLYAAVVKNLSELHYASAETQLADLKSQIKKKTEELAAAALVNNGSGASAPASNTPPGSGFSYQSVHTDSGEFRVSIVAANLSSTRVIVDTASEGDCSDNCPVLPLGDFVARNGAFAGINGTYFCPAAYPSCAGKTNSFDLLVMNKNKKYLNSSNNVYSNNPAFILGSGFVRVVGHASEWGRDTSVDAVISNYPLLVSGGNIVYSDNPDPKFDSKGPRCFIASKGTTVYIGFVANATMGDSAKVLKALGMDNAMNLDEGGSTALWSGGYKAGPGRNIPNAILFVHR